MSPLVRTTPHGTGCAEGLLPIGPARQDSDDGARHLRGAHDEVQQKRAARHLEVQDTRGGGGGGGGSAGCSAARRRSAAGLGVVGVVIYLLVSLRRRWRRRAGGVGDPRPAGPARPAGHRRQLGDREEVQDRRGREHQARVRGRRRHRLDPGVLDRRSCPSSAEATPRSRPCGSPARSRPAAAAPTAAPARSTARPTSASTSTCRSTTTSSPQFHATGGLFVDAYVLAHEYGHHVQDLLGVESKVQHPARGRSRTRCGSNCRPTATPACGPSTPPSRENGEPALVDDITDQDFKNALQVAAQIGDDWIQKNLGGGQINQNSFTHGTGAQRRSGSPPATRPATPRPATPSAPTTSVSEGLEPRKGRTAAPWAGTTFSSETSERRGSLDVEAEGAQLLAAVVGDLVRAPRRHPDPVDLAPPRPAASGRRSGRRAPGPR